MLENDEFKFRYAETKDKKVYISHRLNDDDQQHVKEKVLIRYALKFNLSEIQVQNLVDKLGFVHKGTMDFLESLKQKGSLDYRIIGPGVFAIEVKSKDITVQDEKKIHLTPEQKLYQKAQGLPKIQYIEFQEAMKIEKLQKQFLEKSWKEVKEIINLRIEVRKTSISEDLEDGGLNTNEFAETQKSIEDLEIEDNFRKYGIGETNEERDARIKENEEVQQLIKKLEEQERKKNKDETGYFETNDERIARETREKIFKNKLKKKKSLIKK